MRAMTWWDHETDSVWSQPWGRAIRGPLEGTRLNLIPAGIVPWATWLREHPDTLLLDNGGRGQAFRPDYVIGVTLGEYAKAYRYESASQQEVLNDQIGPFPVVVLTDPETKAVHLYLRTVGDRDLEFTSLDGRPVDRETGSTWDVVRGIAVDGPLQGEVLQRVPYITSFDWAWRDFYPHSEFYE